MERWRIPKRPRSEREKKKPKGTTQGSEPQGLRTSSEDARSGGPKQRTFQGDLRAIYKPIDPEEGMVQRELREKLGGRNPHL